jgi:hypothetical protein
MVGSQEEGANIDFVTDNQGNYKKFNAGKESALLSNNGDMFKLLFEEISLKNLNFTVRWMPNHSALKGIDVPPDVSELDIIGNSFADDQAGFAAEAHVINLNASSVVLWYSFLATRIQKRNVCILASFDARKRGEDINKPEVILPKHPDPALLFPFSSHVPFFTESGFIRCARCNQSYHRKHEYVRKWLITDCPMINSDADKPRPLALELLHVGNKSIHHSHQMNTFRGLVYCRVCGARVGKSAAGFLRLLAKPCTCPGDYGKDNKKRLVEGRLPRGVKTWPCDDIVDVQTAKRVRAKPLSDFETKVLEDHPGLTTVEAKVVASTLLRCADYAASLGSSSSSKQQ